MLIQKTTEGGFIISLRKENIKRRLLEVNTCNHSSGCPKYLSGEHINPLFDDKGIIVDENTRSFFAEICENYIGLITDIAVEKEMEINKANICKIIEEYIIQQ